MAKRGSDLVGRRYSRSGVYEQSHGAAHFGKSAQELGSGESHDALFIAVSIAFPSKSHAVTIDAEQALIATRQVFRSPSRVTRQCRLDLSSMASPRWPSLR
jgi:hypothetical protein